MTAANGEVSIPVNGLPEGELTKYVYTTADMVDVRFLVVRGGDGSIMTALDACQICGPVGYGQDREEAICKRCNAPIAMDTIGAGGGCNPLPLAAGLANDAVVVPVAELVKAEVTFQ